MYCYVLKLLFLITQSYFLKQAATSIYSEVRALYKKESFWKSESEVLSKSLLEVFLDLLGFILLKMILFYSIATNLLFKGVLAWQAVGWK